MDDLTTWLTQDVPRWTVFVAIVGATLGARAWAEVVEYRRKKRRDG